MRITNLKFGNLSIIESGACFGNMNTQKAFYPESFTKEEIKNDFLERRILLGNEYGFDGHKMYLPDQVHKTGSYFEITKEYVEANPNGWTDINEDILVMKSDVLDAAIGYPVADCAVLVAYDPKSEVAGITHCSAALLDMGIAEKLVDALQDRFSSSKDDIKVYVSASAGKDWTYDSFPKWATQERVWDGFIEQESDSLFRIDLKGAIQNQLVKYGIKEDNIVVSPYDTITDERFYSNAAAHNDPSLTKKKGRNFAGACFSSKK